MTDRIAEIMEAEGIDFCTAVEKLAAAQKDLGEASVLNPEPAIPANPAVARKKLATQLYWRMIRDSGGHLPPSQAAVLVADLLGTTALHVGMMVDGVLSDCRGRDTQQGPTTDGADGFLVG